MTSVQLEVLATGVNHAKGWSTRVREVHGSGSESTTAVVPQRQRSQEKFTGDGASEWRTTSSEMRTLDRQGCWKAADRGPSHCTMRNGVDKFCIKMKVARSEDEVLTKHGNWPKSEAHPWREFGVFLKTGDVWGVAANSGGRRPSRTRSQPHRHWFIPESPRFSPSVPQKPLSSSVVFACSKEGQTTP